MGCAKEVAWDFSRSLLSCKAMYRHKGLLAEIGKAPEVIVTQRAPGCSSSMTATGAR
jgi:hypothetical protein